MEDTFSSKQTAQNGMEHSASEPDDSTRTQSFLDQKNWEKEGILIESHPANSCEKVKEFRGNLIANVSHDLRTPLQSIIGYAETMLLKQGKLSDEEEKNYLDVILKSANKLCFLIEEFFEYSKLEVSEVNPQKALFSPDIIIQELNENYRLIAAEKRINLTIENTAELPCIYGDYLMIYRVFQNLIDNAFKFTPPSGKIVVNFAKYSPRELQVQISDTGAGIPKEALDAIFNKFQMTQEMANGQERNDGMGLGLAIVKKILSMHDAKIFVQSELGLGTTFTFYLPLC